MQLGSIALDKATSTHKTSEIGLVAAFVLLVPGYFLYHWLARLQWIPLFLGGYTNESSTLVLLYGALLGVLSLQAPREPTSAPRAFQALALINALYFLLTILLHFGLGTAPEVSISHFAGWLQLMAIYVVFRYTDLSSPDLHRALLISLWLSSAFVYHAAWDDALELLIATAGNTKNATYQGLARALLMVVCTVVPFLNSLPARMFNYANALGVLFLLGARSEVLALVVFVGALGLLEARRKMFLVALWAVPALGVYSFSQQLLDLIPDNRILALLEVTDDISFQERSIQIEFAASTIANHPVVGHYGSYMVLGGPGHYAHNMLSIWQDLGFFGLALMVALFATVITWYFRAFDVYSGRLQLFDRRLLFVGAAQLAVTLFLLLTAKPFSDITTGLLIGLTGQLQARLRKT